MSKTAWTFDADAETEELLGARITIGGRQFHPTLLTPDVRTDQVTIQVENAKLLRANGLDGSGTAATDEQLDSRVQTLSQLDESTYRQLVLLLADENGSHPDYDFLVSKLDRRIAQRLLEKLTEDADEKDGSAEGEANAPTTGA